MFIPADPMAGKPRLCVGPPGREKRQKLPEVTGVGEFPALGFGSYGHPMTVGWPFFVPDIPKIRRLSYATLGRV
jgi:hypothetical protein